MIIWRIETKCCGTGPTQQVAFARCHSRIAKEIELNEDTALIVACLLSKVKPR